MSKAPLVAAGTLATLAKRQYAACTKGFKIIQLSFSIQVSTVLSAVPTNSRNKARALRPTVGQ